MRILVQILALLILVCIGWNEPFCDTAKTILPWAQIEPSRLSLIKARAVVTPFPVEARPTMPPPNRNQAVNPLSAPSHR